MNTRLSKNHQTPRKASNVKEEPTLKSSLKEIESMQGEGEKVITILREKRGAISFMK